MNQYIVTFKVKDSYRGGSYRSYVVSAINDGVAVGIALARAQEDGYKYFESVEWKEVESPDGD